MCVCVCVEYESREAYKVGTVVDSRGLGRGTTENLRLPRIQVRIKVDHGNRSINLVDASQQRKCDGVVATQSDNARRSLALDAGARLIGVRGRLPGQQCVVAPFNLLDSISVIVSAGQKISIHT